MLQRLSFCSFIVVLMAFSLAACGGGQASPPEVVAPESPAEAVTEAEPAVTLYYKQGAQFEVTSPAGARVLIDVAAPNALSSPPTDADVLLTTHGHGDHLSRSFLESFPGQQLYIEEGEINFADVAVRGIKASHGAHEPDGSNYIFIVDMAGLRIAHFGDIGQEQFTQEQLDVLGEVDIAITQLENSYSQMSLANKKGFNLMDQLQPKIIIPHHGNGNQDVIKYAIEKWGDAYVGAETVIIERSDLSEQTKFLILQDSLMASAYRKLFELPEWQ